MQPTEKWGHFLFFWAHPHPALAKGLSGLERLSFCFFSWWTFGEHTASDFCLFIRHCPVIAGGLLVSMQLKCISSPGFRVCPVLSEAGCFSFNPLSHNICLRWSANFNVNPSKSNNANGKKPYSCTHRPYPQMCGCMYVLIHPYAVLHSIFSNYMRKEETFMALYLNIASPPG